MILATAQEISRLVRRESTKELANRKTIENSMDLDLHPGRSLGLVFGGEVFRLSRSLALLETVEVTCLLRENL